MHGSELVRRAAILKAMGHPSRLKMLEALQDGEKCPCELQRLVGSDLSTVSRHLGVLRTAGLVSDEKRGLQVFYRLRVPCIADFLDCCDRVISAAPSGTGSESS
ncbi:MAG: metalloregulator ArsR/SmtB family transcription factor [Fimbriimonadaceae bacterium]